MFLKIDTQWNIYMQAIKHKHCTVSNHAHGFKHFQVTPTLTHTQSLTTHTGENKKDIKNYDQ